MFAIKLLMEKGINNFWSAGFSDLTAINATVFKNVDEKWSRTFYFEIHRAPSEIHANLPDQFSRSGQIFLHLSVATLRGYIGFQNKKF